MSPGCRWKAVWTRNSGILGPPSVVWERGGWKTRNFNDSVGKGWGSLVFQWEPRGCFAWQPTPPRKGAPWCEGYLGAPLPEPPPRVGETRRPEAPLPRHSLDSMGTGRGFVPPAAPSSPATSSFSYPFYRWKSEIKSLAQGCQLQSHSDPTLS